MHQFTSRGHTFWSNCWNFNFFSVLETRHPHLSRNTKISSIGVWKGFQICNQSQNQKAVEKDKIADISIPYLVASKWPLTLKYVPKSYKYPPDSGFLKKKKFGHFGVGFWANFLYFLNISLPKTHKKIKKKKKSLIPFFSQQSRGSVLTLFFLSLVLGP